MQLKRQQVLTRYIIKIIKNKQQMSFINFNNRKEDSSPTYSADVIKEALNLVETKNTNRIEKMLEGVNTPLSLNEALTFFTTGKINAMVALTTAAVAFESDLNLPAEELESDLEDTTPEVKDADGKKYVKAEDRSEETEEVEDELVDGEDGAKEVAEGDLNLPAEELESDLEDTTPEVVDADGKKYVKAKDRSEETEEVEDDLVDGEDGAKEVAEGDLNLPAEELESDLEDTTPEVKDADGKKYVKAKDRSEETEEVEDELVDGEDGAKEVAEGKISWDSLIEKIKGTSEHHTDDPNDKYIVKPCDEEGTPWAVWEGDVRVECFKTEEEAEAYATEQNKEQGLDEAKPAGLSKKETLKVAQKFADALTKLDGMKYTVSSDYEEDSFDLDIEDQDDVDPRITGEYAGGSYNINDDGSVVNMATWNRKTNVSPVYGNIDDDVKTIIKTIKNLKESVVTEAIKEVTLSNEILNFLEERGVIKASDSQKIHKDLTAFLKKNLNESVVTEAKDDFMAKHSGTNITLKKGYKHHTEDELTDLYNKIGELVKDDLKVKDVTIVFEAFSRMASDTVENESVVTEAKFFRLPKQLNAMWELKNSVDYMVGKHDAGDDYKPADMKTIEEFIKKIKQSAKAFKDAEEVKGTVYEEFASEVNESKVTKIQ